MDVQGNVEIWRNKGCFPTEASPAGRRACSVEMRGDQILEIFSLNFFLTEEYLRVTLIIKTVKVHSKSDSNFVILNYFYEVSK